MGATLVLIALATAQRGLVPTPSGFSSGQKAVHK